MDHRVSEVLIGLEDIHYVVTAKCPLYLRQFGTFPGKVGRIYQGSIEISQKMLMKRYIKA